MTSPYVCTSRRFVLNRHSDPTGVAGTGIVAEGVCFSDGTAALRWYARIGAEHNVDIDGSTAVWPDMESLYAVHGHHGLTELVWLD